jgi:hypothetical protein
LGAVDEVVHSIEATEQGGLSTPGRPDESGDSPRGDIQGHIVQDLVRAVLEIEVLDLDRGAGYLFRAGEGRWRVDPGL